MTAPARALDPAATLDDLLAIPEEERKRFELVEGAITDRGATSGEHGAAQFKLSRHIGPFDRRPGGRSPGGWWFATEVDVTFDAANTFRPDVVGWRRERVPERPRGLPIVVRPDWVCEILSKSNATVDLLDKVRIYHRAGVPHYWILDPHRETLRVHRWTEPGYQVVLDVGRDAVVRAEPFDAIEIAVMDLFDQEDEPA